MSSPTNAGPAPRGYLLVETVFCDAEEDREVQRTYFARFRRTLYSLARVRVPAGLSATHLVYVSADKQRWLPELEALAARSPRGGIRARVVRYGHPAEGYASGGQTHPDVLKGPNKQHPLRNALFQSTEEVDPQSPYDYIVRCTLDDDDLWLPWQAEEIQRVCHDLVAESVDQVVGVGLRRNLLAHSGDEGVQVQFTEMKRMLTGNKFYYYPRTAFDRLVTLSPWNVPEQMTENYRERYRATGVDLRIQEENRPGFVYLRRGSNLSAQQKTGFVTRTFGALSYPDEAEMYRALAAGAAPAGAPESMAGIRYGIDPAEYRLTVRRLPNGDVAFDTNAPEVYGTAARYAFHLLRGVETVQEQAYSPRASGVFRAAPSRCRVKIYVRSEDGRRESRMSNVV